MVAAALALPACERGAERPAVDPSAIALSRDEMKLVTGSVGSGAFRGEASYVLIDAQNRSADDLEVTLRARFESSEGDEMGVSARQSLRIPAGGRRTFALVDSKSAAHPPGTRAEVELVGAIRVDYPPPVIITEGHVYDDRGRAVVAGYVENTAAREVKAIVIASFYDAEGVLMKRPSSLFELDGHHRRGVQFVGPPGSRSAYLFVGQFVY